jgi:glucose/arabinose dehydrogenase
MQKFYLCCSKGFILFSWLLIYFNLSVSGQPAVAFQPVISGLTSPIDLVHANDGSNRIFIAQQGGTIRVYNPDYSLIGDFLTVTGIVSGGEQGLLSLAFHPDYGNPDPAIGGFLYVYYTNSAGNLEVARYHANPSNANTVNPSTKQVILTIPHPVNLNHNGAKLNFADSTLYFATGDGGSGGDPPNNAQNPNVLLGKMLRIIVTNSAAAPFYREPTNNPWYGVQTPVDTLDAIWAFGLRNPFRWSFDRETGDMWIGDVGQEAREEINFTPASSNGGENYGWRCHEGSVPYIPAVCVIPGAQGPVFDYPNPVGGSAAVTGGVVYRGSVYPMLRGYYMASDVYSNALYLINSTTFVATERTGVNGAPPAIVCYGESEAGEVYAVSLVGTIYQVVIPGTLPASLVEFKAVARNGVASLNWKTEFEQNLKQFEIEYSTDNNNYIRVGIVQATNASDGAEYSFEHILNHTGLLYYRLRIVELDGSHEYSPIRVVDPGTKNKVFIYPSIITTGVINVFVSEPWQTIEVINMNGAIVRKLSIAGRSGKIEIPVHVLSAGNYVVRLRNNEKVMIQKVVIR